MAYVRRHGNQLAIVHGVRDPQTQQVQQQTLFTLYSKAEALEALGRNEGGASAQHFRNLLEASYPPLRLDWKKIEAGIEENLEHLPDRYPYRTARLRDQFREDLVKLTRQLLLADPQLLLSAADLVREHRQELAYLSELIQWRLKLCEQEHRAFNTDNPFFWRLRLQGSDLPPEADEEIGSLYERGEYDKVEALARLFLDCFPDYADGHNYLGLVALERGELDQAIAHFRTTMTVGRRLFPGRIARKHYWVELNTRPYMRGMRNLALTLNRSGQYPEALELCDRLEQECGDDLTAAAYRADLFLNLGRWEEARAAAKEVVGLWPDSAFQLAFALFELGEAQEARVWFLHAALRYPRAARLVVGLQTTKPRAWTWQEATSHNVGVNVLNNLPAYRGRAGLALKSFRDFIRQPDKAALLDEVEEIERRRAQPQPPGDREAFDRLRQLQALDFARQQVTATA